MKSVWKKRFWPLNVVVAIALLGALVGCSEDSPSTSDGDVSTTPSAVKVTGIIFNPKSPAPGDTITCTAVVTAGTLNTGDFVRFQWSSSGGTFIETNKTSVRWVAPLNSTIYDITVRATNNVSTAQRMGSIFVGQLANFISFRAGEMHGTPAGDVFYLSSLTDPDSPFFLGVRIRKKLATGADTQVNGNEGFQHSFNRDLTHDVHTEFDPVQFKLHIVMDDLSTGASTQVAKDPRFLPPREGTFNAFLSPNIQPTGDLITYMGILADSVAPTSGGVDTFAVFTYDKSTLQTRQVTQVLGKKNFYPSFSSDSNLLVFLSDRSAPQQWEYYSLPVEAGVVPLDTDPGKLVRLTDTGGRIADAVLQPEAPFAKWNPDPADPLLAVVDRNDQLRIVATDGSGDALVGIPNRIRDFQWAADGERLAATTGAALYVVDKTGGEQLVHTAPQGDRLSRFGWSPDGSLLVFQVLRGSDTWYEFFDVDGTTGISDAIKITSAVDDDISASYTPFMRLNALWQPSGTGVHLLFFDQSTPRARTLDLSGIVP